MSAMMTVVTALAILAVTAEPGDALPKPVEIPVKIWTATAAAEPRPALRIELLPPLNDRIAEDASPNYYRAFLARPSPTSLPGGKQTVEKKLQEWTSDTPLRDLKELPLSEVREVLKPYRRSLEELERGSRCNRCDFGMLARLRKEGIAVLLPEAQPAREVARYLVLQTRLELAERRFAAAERSLQTGLQFAQHLGEQPTLIRMLIGIAIEQMMLNCVEDWIATPGSPNLYWALTALPRPLIHPRTAFAGEALFLEAMVPNLAKLRGGPLPQSEADRLLAAVFDDLKNLEPMLRTNPEPLLLESVLKKIGLAGYVLWHYATAKKEMLARGRPEKDVEAMPGAQLVFVNAVEKFLEARDSQWKWLNVPFHQQYPKLQQLENRIKEESSLNRLDLFYQIFSLTLPAYNQVMIASGRVQRRVAALRTIEAVRMYAAEHQNRLPDKLSDITAVPIPDDPWTGQPFEYRRFTEKSFFLIGPTPTGEMPSERNTLKYQITILPVP